MQEPSGHYDLEITTSSRQNRKEAGIHQTTSPENNEVFKYAAPYFTRTIVTKPESDTNYFGSIIALVGAIYYFNFLSDSTTFFSEKFDTPSTSHKYTPDLTYLATSLTSLALELMYAKLQLAAIELLFSKPTAQAPKAQINPQYSARQELEPKDLELAIASSNLFHKWSATETSELIETRHEDVAHQEAYDQRFGLIPFFTKPQIINNVARSARIFMFGEAPEMEREGAVARARALAQLTSATESTEQTTSPAL